MCEARPRGGSHARRRNRRATEVAFRASNPERAPAKVGTLLSRAYVGKSAAVILRPASVSLGSVHPRPKRAALQAHTRNARVGDKLQMVVDCSAFQKNADGSWTVTKETVVELGPPGAGAPAIGLSIGTRIVSTEYIVDNVALVSVLDRECTSKGA